MTDTKPEALRLADFFETDSSSTFAEFRAATELRRLHEVNAELLEALKAMVKDFDGCYAEGEPAMIKARAAIAKAEGSK
jgi:hypothetical protein